MGCMCDRFSGAAVRTGGFHKTIRLRRGIRGGRECNHRPLAPTDDGNYDRKSLCKPANSHTDNFPMSRTRMGFEPVNGYNMRIGYTRARRRRNTRSKKSAPNLSSRG
ncbi:MAG: hypothetical protein QG552_2177 [Thermodesulfobacteriota bacterium]|nr:hypothetical protein [Thermodesulfobacteriota bacterium]